MNENVEDDRKRQQCSTKVRRKTSKGEHGGQEKDDDGLNVPRSLPRMQTVSKISPTNKR